MGPWESRWISQYRHTEPLCGRDDAAAGGEREQFISRYMATAPETGARVTEHLLDGQQSLTAFWRAMQNNYEGETYCVYLPEFESPRVF